MRTMPYAMTTSSKDNRDRNRKQGSIRADPILKIKETYSTSDGELQLRSWDYRIARGESSSSLIEWHPMYSPLLIASLLHAYSGFLDGLVNRNRKSDKRKHTNKTLPKLPTQSNLIEKDEQDSKEPQSVSHILGGLMTCRKCTPSKPVQQAATSLRVRIVVTSRYY